METTGPKSAGWDIGLLCIGLSAQTNPVSEFLFTKCIKTAKMPIRATFIEE
jgi:hypothetical protein